LDFHATVSPICTHRQEIWIQVILAVMVLVVTLYPTFYKQTMLLKFSVPLLSRIEIYCRVKTRKSRFKTSTVVFKSMFTLHDEKTNIVHTKSIIQWLDSFVFNVRASEFKLSVFSCVFSCLIYIVLLQCTICLPCNTKQVQVYNGEMWLQLWEHPPRKGTGGNLPPLEPFLFQKHSFKIGT